MPKAETYEEATAELKAQTTMQPNHAMAPVAKLPESTDRGFMSIIDKVAALDNIDVDKLERMMAMQLQWEDRKAETEFNEAVARVHAALGNVRIVKKKGVSYDGKKDAFKYAPIEDIDKIARPFLSAEGIRVSYTQKAASGNIYETVCRLSRGRQFCEASAFVPVDASGGKNAAQAMGSGSRYGERYSFCAVLNIVTVGEDDDGMGGTIDDAQAATIKKLIKDSGADTTRFLKYMKADNVEAILFKDYRKATSMLEEKMAKTKQEK